MGRGLGPLRFVLWSLRNPGRSFTDFYADRVISSIANGKRHSSLGPNLKPGSSEGANRTFFWLLRQGVQPNDIVVDYGCGTLRVGVLLIEYLDADRYVGMDIDERILNLGRSALTPTLVESKHPTLELISAESLDRIAGKGPKWVFSKGVLQHVPPNELHEYFLRLSCLIHAGATGFIRVRVASAVKRLGPKTWVHGLSQLEATALCYRMTFKRFDLKEFYRLTSLDA